MPVKAHCNQDKDKETRFALDYSLLCTKNSDMSNLTLSLCQARQRLQTGVLSAVEICEETINKAELMKNLNAFIRITKDSARSQAKAASWRIEKGTVKGPLDGIPIAVKDNFCTYNIETTCGSHMLKNFIPKYNATVVQKLLDSGAVLLGKCNMDEFAMGCGTIDSAFGPTKNIWKSEFDPLSMDNNYRRKRYASDNLKFQTDALQDWHIAGGSSGGSAVAVASGIVFAALGSDTGGSTRNPAAYCGVVGLKPSFGLLSRHGLIPLVNSMDVPGILTRTVEDCAAVLSIIAGHDIKDSTTVSVRNIPVQSDKDINLKKLCVGIPIEYHSPGLSGEVLTTWTKISDMLEAAGAKVIQVSLPHTQSSVICYSVLNQCEVASNMARYDGIEYGLRTPEKKSTEELYASSRREGFGEVVRSRILAGNYFLLERNYKKYFLQALKVRRLIAKDFEDVWLSGVDVLLTPTTLSEAPKYTDFTKLENQQQCLAQDYCTQPINLAGCPAISIPIQVSKNGLPISLQLITKCYEEQLLISVAKWIEEQVQFTKLNCRREK